MIDLDLPILILAIIVHEFGHFIHFKIGGYKPKIRFTFFGLITTTNKNQNVGYEISNIIFAIGVGLIVVSFASVTFEFLYILMCMLDFALIITYLNMISEKKITFHTKVGNIRVVVDKEVHDK